MATLSSEARGWVYKLASLGIRLAPALPGGKAPAIANWKEGLSPEQLIPLLENGFGLGLITGPVNSPDSLILVCVDFDRPEVVRLAEMFLPQTRAIDGRPSRPKSHWFYLVDKALPLTVFKDPSGNRLFEVFSREHFVVIPPSTHPSGEQREWLYPPSEEDWLPVVSSQLLYRQMCKVALMASLLPLWTEGNRHELALQLAGSMVRARVAPEEAFEIVTAICNLAGDPELENRVEAVQDTYEKAMRGQYVRGLPNDLHRAVFQWLTVFGSVPEIRGHILIENHLYGEVLRQLIHVVSSRSDVFFMSDGSQIAKINQNEIYRFDTTKSGAWIQILEELGIRFVKRTSKGEKVIDPPAVIREGLARTQWAEYFSHHPNLHLLGVRQIPSVHHFTAGVKDGWYLLSDREPNPSEAPSHIQRILDGFNFYSELDRAAAIALVLSTVIYPHYRVPFFIISAPAPRCGKTELALRVKLLVDGEEDFLPMSSDEEEFRKVLASVQLTSGHDVLVFDNLETIRHSATLLTAATTEFISLRLLGSNKITRFNAQRIFIFNGNSIQWDEEYERRSILIRLEKGSFQSRESPSAIKMWIKRNRVQIAADIAAWLMAAFERHREQAERLASEWRWDDTWADFARLVAAAILELGLGSLVTSIAATPDRASDRNRQKALERQRWPRLVEEELSDQPLAKRMQVASRRAACIAGVEPEERPDGELDLKTVHLWLDSPGEPRETIQPDEDTISLDRGGSDAEDQVGRT